MNLRPFSLVAALFLTSCASSYVQHTDIATGATDPKAIYIRPFDVSEADFRGHHGDSRGERPIRRSMAPAEFSEALKEELEKIAPTKVLKGDEIPPRVGWLVRGYFEVVDAGNPWERAALPAPNPLGRSKLKIHVQVLDLEHHKVLASTKNTVTEADTLHGHGNVIYEFDLLGGSGLTGAFGSLHAPGLGYAMPFDYRNAAERIARVLTPDSHRYGARHATTIR